MIGFLWRMIVGRFTSCRHRWEKTATLTVGPVGKDHAVAYQFVMTCEHCGEITSRRVSVND